MKNPIFTLLITFLFLNSCVRKIFMEQQALKNTLDSGEFVFSAKRANPTNYAVINTISSIPNAPSTRILDLDNGYGITFNKKQIVVALPYFGRAYKTPINTSDTSFRFTTKEYSWTKTDGKKGKVTYTIVPKDISNIQKIYLEVFPTGSAMVSVDSNDRQPISYDGYIEKLPQDQP
jgi:hypothetical protein